MSTTTDTEILETANEARNELARHQREVEQLAIAASAAERAFKTDPTPQTHAEVAVSGQKLANARAALEEFRPTADSAFAAERRLEVRLRIAELEKDTTPWQQRVVQHLESIESEFDRFTASLSEACSDLNRTLKFDFARANELQNLRNELGLPTERASEVSLAYALEPLRGRLARRFGQALTTDNARLFAGIGWSAGAGSGPYISTQINIPAP